MRFFRKTFFIKLVVTKYKRTTVIITYLIINNYNINNIQWKLHITKGERTAKIGLLYTNFAILLLRQISFVVRVREYYRSLYFVLKRFRQNHNCTKKKT